MTFLLIIKHSLCFCAQLVEFGSPKRHTANQQTYVNPALVQISDKVTKLAEKVDQQEDKLVMLKCIFLLASFKLLYLSFESYPEFHDWCGKPATQ